MLAGPINTHARLGQQAKSIVSNFGSAVVQIRRAGHPWVPVGRRNMKKQIWLLVGLMGLVLRGFGALAPEDVENKQLFRERIKEMAARAGNLPPSAEEFEQQRRLIFCAVLEGCYEDGVSTEDVSLQYWESGGKYPGSAFTTVHQCAVCNAACGLKLKPDAGK